jgi:cytoskeleton protein RodZ
MLEGETKRQMDYEHIGNLLRSKRKELKCSLKQIADELHIRRAYLDAIEKGEVKEIPSETYYIGYVRSYCRYLGEDENEILLQINQNKEPQEEKLTLKTERRKDDYLLPSRRILFSSIISILFIYVFILFVL